MKTVPHVLAVASAGGHWVQLMRLRPAWKGGRVTYVTTEPDLADAARRSAANDNQPTPAFFAVTEANRWQKMRLVLQLFQILSILLRTRPDIVLSTGAAPGYFALRIGRLIGAKTIWIDSVANAEEMSLSGQKISSHVDLCLTQWEHLARPEGPRYLGSVL